MADKVHSVYCIPKIFLDHIRIWIPVVTRCFLGNRRHRVSRETMSGMFISRVEQRLQNKVYPRSIPAWRLFQCWGCLDTTCQNDSAHGCLDTTPSIFIFILHTSDWESVKGHNFDRIDVNLSRAFFIFRPFYKITCWSYTGTCKYMYTLSCNFVEFYKFILVICVFIPFLKICLNFCNWRRYDCIFAAK